jgi:hypothetical protein
VKIACLHGYFLFTEDKQGEVAEFNSLYEQDLVPKDNYYTFELLADAKLYSLVASPYLDLPATVTYAGNPWDILEQNAFVYNFNTKLVVPFVSITTKIEPIQLYNGYTLRGLIQPGSVNNAWMRIKNYKCHLDLKKMIFDYSEVVYA